MIAAAGRRVLITGCSGGGKSTLLAELARRGHRTVEEPGRRVIAEARQEGSAALPWLDMEAFARRALALSIADYRLVEVDDRTTFFDRGIIDAAVALAHATGRPIDPAVDTYRYHERVFVAPPWPAIFSGDAERRHGLDAATAEHDRLIEALPRLGYEMIALPQLNVAERALFVIDALG